MQDRIERTIAISAPLERVWELVTEPGWWVPSDAAVEADRTAGAVVVRESQQWGRFPVEVVELRPMTYAAFRWAPTFPGADLAPGRTTLIEFTVTSTGGGVSVAVAESGFAGLEATDEIKATGIKSNTDGWRDQLGVLRTQAEAA